MKRAAAVLLAVCLQAGPVSAQTVSVAPPAAAVPAGALPALSIAPSFGPLLLPSAPAGPALPAFPASRSLPTRIEAGAVPAAAFSAAAEAAARPLRSAAPGSPSRPRLPARIVRRALPSAAARARSAGLEFRAADVEAGRRLFDGAGLRADEPPPVPPAPRKTLPLGVHPVTIAHPEGFSPAAFLPPAPAAPPGPAPGRGERRSVLAFIAGLVTAQVGLEAWSAAWAKWVQTNYGIDRYSLLTMVSMGASLAAGFLGGLAADKLGLKRTYVGAVLLGAGSAAATLALFKLHALPFAALAALAAFRTFVGGVSRTAEQVIPVALYKGDAGRLEKFNSRSQFILEIAGIAVPYGIGSLLGAFGPLGTMSLLPLTAAAAAAVFAFFMKVPETRTAQARPAEAPPAPDPALLKIGSWGYPAFLVLNILLYSILAIGYGNLLFPGGSPADQAGAAGAAGKIVSFYSLGGLAAAALLTGVLPAAWRWLRARLGRPRPAEPPADPSAARRKELKSAFLWTCLGAAGLAGFIPFVFHSPLAASLGMIPFGLTNEMGQIKLVSLIQANVPQDKRGKVMGAVRTGSVLAATAGLFGFSQLLKRHPGGFFPYWVLLGALAGLALYYLWIGLRLRRLLARAPSA